MIFIWQFCLEDIKEVLQSTLLRYLPQRNFSEMKPNVKIRDERDLYTLKQL